MISFENGWIDYQQDFDKMSNFVSMSLDLHPRLLNDMNIMVEHLFHVLNNVLLMMFSALEYIVRVLDVFVHEHVVDEYELIVFYQYYLHRERMDLNNILNR